ncbi:MAG: hypothetical protein ACRDZR_06310 [Acidimicrobiales bacterium]
MEQRDWVEWHRDYDDPGSLLSRRGELVLRHLRAELDHSPAGDILLTRFTTGPAMIDTRFVLFEAGTTSEIDPTSF